MSFGPGTQLTEIINAAILLRNIFDSFFDEFGNAFSQISELRDTVLNLHECLKKHAEILRQRGLIYSGHANFLKTLKECERFIRRYKSIIEPQVGDGAKRFALKAWLATPDAKEEMEKLDRLLNRQATALIMYNTTLQLTLLAQPGEGPPPIQDLEPSHIPPEQEKLWEDFRRVQEEQRQEAMLSPPLERHSIGVKTVRNLLAIIGQHCELLGIPQEQLPDLVPLLSSNSSTGSTAYSMRSDSSVRALNPAELIPCKATVSKTCEDLSKSPLFDYRYLIEPNSATRGRTIHWTEKDGSIVWRHELRPKTYPFTYHTRIGAARQVSFLENQDVYLNGTVYRSLDLSYMFETEEACRKFQSFVRNRELLGVFDVGPIKYKDGQLCSPQQLKIWKRSDVDEEPTISFYADDNDEETERQSHRPPHAEFVIRWFEKHTENLKGSCLRLRFHSKSPKEKHLLKRRKSSDATKRRFSSNKLFSFTSSSSPPLRASRSTSPTHVLYNVDPLEPEEEEKREQNMSFEYLDISFGSHQDRDTFIAACQSAHWPKFLGVHPEKEAEKTPSPLSKSPPSYLVP